MTRLTQKLSQDRIIHQVWGRVSNTYIIEDRVQARTYLVDCGLPSDVADILDHLERMPPLKRVVCTHFHVDHVSGWLRLGKAFNDAEIWFHETGKPYITGNKRIPCPSYRDYVSTFKPCMQEYGYSLRFKDIFNGALYGTPFKQGFPRKGVTYFSTATEALPGFTTLHTPGHRPESVSFFDKDSGILITGDFLIVINDRLITTPYVTDQDAQLESLMRIRQMPGLNMIFPGHGVCKSWL